jgi:hypothetical protein
VGSRSHVRRTREVPARLPKISLINLTLKRIRVIKVKREISLESPRRLVLVLNVANPGT